MRTAAEFVDSVGVNVHLGWLDQPYADTARVLAALQQLGVRHVRDGLSSAAWLPPAARTLADAGVRFCWGAGDPQKRWGTVDPEQVPALLSGPFAGTAALVEGPNEYDLAGDPDWVAVLHSWQARLRKAVTGVPVLAPCVAGWTNRDLYGAEPNCDAGNIHPYPGGGPPESNMPGELAKARAMVGGKPICATETGYYNAPAGFLLRLVCEYFRLGVWRTYLYQLVDAPATEPLGLFQPDWTPRPAALALARLLGEISDKPTRDPGTVQGQVTGPVRSVALARSDGGCNVLLWQPSVPVDAAPVTATVELSERIRQLAPAANTESTVTGSQTCTVRVPAGDVAVLRLRLAT